MAHSLDYLASMPRSQLLTLARATLLRQAALIYDKEALATVALIFAGNTEIMGEEQLAHIVCRGDL